MESYGTSYTGKRADEQNFAYNFRKFKDPSSRVLDFRKKFCSNSPLMRCIKTQGSKCEAKVASHYIYYKVENILQSVALAITIDWMIHSFIYLLFDKCYLAPTIYQGLFLGAGKQWTRQRETQLSWSLHTNVIQAAYTVCNKVKKNMLRSNTRITFKLLIVNLDCTLQSPGAL